MSRFMDFKTFFNRFLYDSEYFSFVAGTILLTVLALILIIHFTRKANKRKKAQKEEENDYYSSSYFHVTQYKLSDVKQDKGVLGEYKTYCKIRELENNGSKLLFNLYLPIGNNETTEIDILLISSCGFFVIENKNYSGWIYGSQNQPYWTQTLKNSAMKEAHKERFANPIWQNDLHASALKEYLQTDCPIHSIVVFSDDCLLKKVTAPTAIVVRQSDLLAEIKRIETSTEEKISSEQIKAVYTALLPLAQADDETRIKHIENIQNTAKNGHTDTAIDMRRTLDYIIESEEGEATVCPICGHALILRTAKSGTLTGKQFYGCSAYPKCKYKSYINIDLEN